MTQKELDNCFIEDAHIGWVQLEEKIRRKIMAYDDHLMMVKVEFKAGGIGQLHQHPHSQITHIESGVFEIEVEKHKKILRAGDAYQIPSNAWHGAVCIEDGVLVDVFSPKREDFLK